jgi:hypothetical protein
MMGPQTGDQSQRFYLFNLEERIPAGHLLRRINPIVTRVLAVSHPRDGAKLAGIYRRRITAASSQEIARYISEDTMARIVIPVMTMFILKICAPYWMR